MYTSMAANGMTTAMQQIGLGMNTPQDFLKLLSLEQFQQLVDGHFHLPLIF